MEWNTIARMQTVKLNVGCGADVASDMRYRGWIGVDREVAAADEAWCVSHTFPAPMPLPDCRASMVLTDHFLEHVTKADAVKVLADLYRVLKQGGSLRVAVPDAYHPSHEKERLKGEDDDPDHLHLWDVSQLVSELVHTGFSQIEPVAFWKINTAGHYEFINRYNDVGVSRGAVNRLPAESVFEDEGIDTFVKGVKTFVKGTSLIVDAVK